MNEMSSLEAFSVKKENVKNEGVEAAGEIEIARRLSELDSGKARTISWQEVRQRNLAKLSSTAL
jgi:hypothetical protein